MDATLFETIEKRKSCRSYGAEVLEPEKLAALEVFITGLGLPFWGNRPRFKILEITKPGQGRMPGTYGMIKGAGIFLAGAMARGHRDMEDFGYLFEKIILHATDLGISTCWIGLTIARGLIAEKIGLGPDETIPAVTPLGYPAPRRTILEGLTRASIRASKRKPWKRLFFDREWGRPLEKSAVNAYEHALEMVRLAPSSTNKQPWRIIRDTKGFHFFLQRSPGYYAKLTSAADLQRIDMGIAMCHFELAARELCLEGHWAEINPRVSIPKGAEYLVTWTGE